MAFIMLVVVLACLGPFGHGWGIIVWPWNVYLFATEMGLFLAPHSNCFQAVRTNWLAWMAMGIFVMAPVLGIWGLWSSMPSFKLYSGNVETGVITLDRRERKEHLPAEIVAAMNLIAKESANSSSQELANVTLRGNIFGYETWLWATNITTHPSERIIRTGSGGLCAYLEYPATAILYIKLPREFDSMKADWKKEPLCPKEAR
jgi:hypothetical protein